jgi:hypothetical protein
VFISTVSAFTVDRRTSSKAAWCGHATRQRRQACQQACHARRTQAPQATNERDGRARHSRRAAVMTALSASAGDRETVGVRKSSDGACSHGVVKVCRAYKNGQKHNTSGAPVTARKRGAAPAAGARTPAHTQLCGHDQRQVVHGAPRGQVARRCPQQRCVVTAPPRTRRAPRTAAAAPPCARNSQGATGSQQRVQAFARRRGGSDDGVLTLADQQAQLRCCWRAPCATQLTLRAAVPGRRTHSAASRQPEAPPGHELAPSLAAGRCVHINNSPLAANPGRSRCLRAQAR